MAFVLWIIIKCQTDGIVPQPLYNYLLMLLILLFSDLLRNYSSVPISFIMIVYYMELSHLKWYSLRSIKICVPSHKNMHSIFGKLYSFCPKISKSYSFLGCPTISESFSFLTKNLQWLYSLPTLFSLYLSTSLSLFILSSLYYNSFNINSLNPVSKRSASLILGRREYQFNNVGPTIY